MTTRRKFLQAAGVGAAAALAAPAVAQAQRIKWRMQTYAGAALAEHVIKPVIDTFNQSPATACRSSCSMPISSSRRASCSRRCSAARSTRCSRMTTRWPRPPKSPCSAAISRSHRYIARRAGAVQPVRPERDLGRGICQGRRQMALGRVMGPLPLRHQDPITALADLKG